MEDFGWLADALHTRERRADYRAGVLATLLSQSKTFRADHVFPSLAGAAGGRTVYAIDEIPEDWVQIKGEEAQQWALALELDRLGKQT